jgi:poly(A) polymerase
MKSPTYYSAEQHGIDPEAIAEEAKIVLRQLKQHGYEAYLVGGGVRDLCLGKTPKDFDIATSAKPEEIKPLFRHCLLIGRRFRLAHVRFRKMIIEVATFRSGDTQSEDLIVHDNTWGTPEDDVLRRDFTINGLFYDLETNTVIDYTDGFADLKSHLLRCIGEPAARFRQDPVRMIRLIKFKARFAEMQVEEATLQALVECKEHIVKSSNARVLEEILRMLESGYSAEFFQVAQHWGLLSYLMPHLNERLSCEDSQTILNYLKTCDKACRFLNPKPHRDVLFSCLIYSLLEDRWQRQPQTLVNKGHEIATQAAEEIEAMTESLRNIPKRMKAAICQIIGMQARIAPSDGPTKRAHKLYMHPDFAYAMELLQLRKQLNSSLDIHIQFWKKFLTETPLQQSQEGSHHNHEGKSRHERSGRHTRRRRQPKQERSQETAEATQESGSEETAPSFSSEENETCTVTKVPAMKMLLAPPTQLIKDCEWTS